MTVEQLLAVLRDAPPNATVLIEGDDGYSPLGSVSVDHLQAGMPPELILHPDMTPD